MAFLGCECDVAALQRHLVGKAAVHLGRRLTFLGPPVTMSDVMEVYDGFIL